MIEAARHQYLTGELTLHTTPTTRVYLRDGVVYFAERTTDGALAIRLMMEGVITREQMQRGTVIVNGVEHVGRMFDADPTIDRSSVELAAELFTDDVLVDVANRTVRGYDLVLYRRHSSGIDRWYPNSIPVTPRQTESAQPEAIVAAEVAVDVKPVDPPTHDVVPEPRAETPQPVRPEPKVETPEPVQPEQEAETPEPVQPEQEADTPEPVQPEQKEQKEQKNKLDAPPITLAVPVTRQVGTITTPPAAMKTQPMPITPLDITNQIPAVPRATPAPPFASAPPLRSNDVDVSSIADEVAEAIKRAFAGLGG